MSQSNSNNNNNNNHPNYRVHHQHYQNHLRQDFDDDLNMDAANSTAANSRPPQKDFRILRCFCGCSQLTFEQIEAYAMMNVKGLIHNDDGNKLLKTFLKIGHRSDKSNALLLLECYECCEQILGDIESYRDHVDDLLELCPSFLWEQKINDATELATADEIHRHLEDVLIALKKECLGNIECDPDFTRFRHELLRKIGK